jgi:hypothetical protein
LRANRLPEGSIPGATVPYIKTTAKAKKDIRVTDQASMVGRWQGRQAVGLLMGQSTTLVHHNVSSNSTSEGPALLSNGMHMLAPPPGRRQQERQYAGQAVCRPNQAPD